MGKSEKVQAKAAAVIKINSDELQEQTLSTEPNEVYEKIKPNLKWLDITKTCHTVCLNMFFTLLGVITMLTTLAVITVTVTTALASKIYSSEQSGRLVAMIVLTVTAGVTLAMTIYAVVAVLRKDRKPLHSASIVLVIIAVIQAVIVGVAVRVTPEDEVLLSRSLSESFRLARDHNPRHVKIWAATQHDLTCCGVYSAEDYRVPNLLYIFPPDVHISCCPDYDPDRSELVQERGRESCKAKKEYYTVGCGNLIVELFKDTASLVMIVTIGLIVLEVILSVLATMAYRRREKQSESEIEENKT